MLIQCRVAGEMLTVGVQCDVCCSQIADPGSDPTSPGFGTLSATWGPGSERFGSKDECHLCSSCFGDVSRHVSNLGGRVRERDLFSNEPEAAIVGEPVGGFAFA